MSFREKFVRVLLAVLFFSMNTHISPVFASGGVPFNGYNAENMDMSPDHWGLNSASLESGTIQMTGSSGDATFLLDVSSIASVIDMGHLELDFSVDVSLTPEGDTGETDHASITIGFSPSSDAPTSTVVLDRDSGGSGKLTSNAAIPAGTRYLFVVAKGTSKADPNTVAFSNFSLIIATQKPTLIHEISPVGWTKNDVTVYLTATDPDSGIEGIYDTSDTKVASAGAYQFTTSTNGSWSFYAKDYEGAISDVVVAEVSGIDREAPALPTLAVDTSDWSKSPVGFTITTADDAGPSPVTLQYRLNGGDWQVSSGSGTISSEGESTIEARAVDGAGNASDVTEPLTVHYDSHAPEITLSSVAHATPPASATVNVAVSESGSGLNIVKYASGSQDVSYFETGAGEVLSGDSFETSGGGTFTVYAADNVGNSSVKQITVNTYPFIGFIDSQTMDEDSTLFVNVTVGDIETEGGYLEVTATSSNTSLIDRPGITDADGAVAIGLQPEPNTSGSTTITVKVKDAEGLSASQTFNLTVNPVEDAPTAAADEYELNEDQKLTVSAASGVLANDQDVDGDTLSALLVSSTVNGTLVLNADGSFQYTPNSDYSGSDSFTYQVSDGLLTSEAVTVTLTIRAVDDSPVAGDDAYSLDEDNLLSVSAENGLLTNDSDNDSPAITAVLAEGPSHGELTLNSDGSFEYRPAANYNGTDSFTYHASDGNSFSNTAKVTITINGVNDAPIATVDSYTATEDEPLSVSAEDGVLVNDTDLEGDPLTATLVTSTTRGSVSLNPDGSFTYTPEANFNGTDSFTYSASDGTLSSEPVTVTITVEGANDSPVASEDSYDVEEDSELSIDAPGVLANDTDVDGDALTAVLVAGPEHGTFSFNADGSFTYTPAGDFNGTDQFTYKANDGTTDSEATTVTLNVAAVNDAPVGAADSYSINEDENLSVSVTTGVLANDTDADGDELSASLLTEPAHGTLSFNPDGSFSYLPVLNYNGPDSFTYQPFDGNLYGAETRVSITVGSVNDAPAASDDIAETGEDTPVEINVLANDQDVEGSVLTPIIVTQPEQGTATVKEGGAIEYAPAENYFGPDSFTYKVNDGELDSNLATVTVTIDSFNDAPVTAVDSYSTDEDTPLSIPAAGVMTNDMDVEGDALTAILVTDVTHGTLTLNADGSFDYTPEANFNGSDSFTYKANDGELDGNVATVTLTVNAVNDAPVATPDEYSTDEDTALDVSAEDGVLQNDHDVEASSLSATLATSTSHGSLIFNSDGSFSYAPATNYNGSDSFTYKPYDGSAYGTVVTVTLTINSVDDAPVATDDSVTLNEDTPTTINVLGNDSDVDKVTNPGAEHLTLSEVSDPPHGTATIVSNQVLYVPDGDYNGSDSFTYTVIDDSGLSDTATVNLTINPVNDYPVFSNLNSEYTTNEDETITLTFNISDVETPTESLMLQVTSGDTGKVANSDLTLSGLGDNDSTTTLKIKPTLNMNGDVTITLRLGDGFVVTTQSFTLHITPVNDAPKANSDSYSFTEDTPITLDMDDLVKNDTDIDGDPLSFVSYSAPSLAGTLTVLSESDHTYTFTPNANFDGTTTFTYTMTDGTVTQTATVSLVAIPVNDPPTLVMDAENPTESDEDVPLTLKYTVHDWETTASALSEHLGSSDPNLVAASNITNSCDSAGHCTAVVTPNEDQNGSVTLTFAVSDGVYLIPVTIPLVFNPVEDQPTVVPDIYTVHENSTINFSPLENDFDVDSGDTISLESVSADSSIGTLTYTSAGVFTYTPPTNFKGTQTFDYTITDGTLSTTGTVTLNVTNLNNPPTITPIVHQYILEDETLSALAFSVSDVEGDVLTVTGSSSDPAIVLSDDSHISVSHVSGKEYTVTIVPVANAFGDTTITISANDGQITSTTSFTLTVYPVNDPPTAVDDDVVTDEDTAVSFNPLLNDLDIESTPDQLEVIEMSSPAHGLLTKSGKTYTYTPFADYNGTDTMSYTMSDGAARDSAVITVTVNPVNDPPDAWDDWIEVANTVGASITFHPMNNDYSGDDGDTISLVDPVVSGPTSGTAVVNPDGTITYTRTSAPADSRDSFVYKITDSGGLTDTATVHIAEDWGPSMQAHDRYFYMNEDCDPQTISLVIGDGKGDGWTLSVSSATLGSVSYDADNGNSIVYTPNLNANGHETLTYTVTSKTDASLTSTAHIYITIYPVNDLPTVTDVEKVTIPEDTSTGPIQVTIDDVDDPVDSLIFNVYSMNQQLVLNRDITVTRTAGSGTVTFTITPIPNRWGTANIEMLVSDAIGYTTRTFELEVTSVNDPPIADDYSASVIEDGSVNLTLITPLSDADGDPLTLTVISDPTNGTAVVNADQTVTYTPTPNYSGTDSFVYQLDDGNPGGTDTGVVSLTVIEVDDGPVITNLEYAHSTLEDTPIGVPFTVTDIDTPLEDLEYTISSSNASLFPTGSYVLSGDSNDKVLTLTPAANLSGEAIFTIRVSDGTLYDQQTFKVVVDPVNDLPVALDDTATTNEDTSVLIGVTANDSDVEDAVLTVASLTSPAHGTVVNNRNGTITYTPSHNWNGVDSFNYTVTDHSNGSATAKVTVTVTPVNDAPAANTDYVTIVEDNSATIRPLTNDSDVEGDPISLVSYGVVSHGYLTKNEDNSFLYVPNLDYYGSDSFTYTITDGLLNSTGTVRITITSVNDAPRLSTPDPLPWTMDEDTPTSFPIHIYDPETPADNLVIKITSSDQTIIPNTSIKLNGSGQDKTLLLTPNLNKFGTLDIQIEATDGELTTTEIFPVLVQSVNDLPTISDIKDQTTNEDTPTSEIPFSLTDIETSAGDLTVTVASSNSTLIPVVNIIITNLGGTSRKVQITPAANLVGKSTVTLTVHDADGGSASDSFVVTVVPVNDPPTAADDTATVAEDQSVTIDVLANDTDVDIANEGDDLTLVSTAGVDNAVVTIAANKKSLIFTPDANWNGEEDFTYTITDSHEATSTATVRVSVTPVNDPPEARPDTASMDEDGAAISILVLENDQDIDFDTTLNHPVSEEFFVDSVTQPANGTVTIDTDNKSVSYKPNLNWNGEETFTYTMKDKAGVTSTADVTVTVDPVNDVPTISDIPDQTIDEDTSTGAISFTVADVEDDVVPVNLTVTAVSANTTILPTVTLGGSGGSRTITVTPAANRNTYLSGPIMITVTVTDSAGATAQDTFKVTVNKVNDPPVAPTLTLSMNEDQSLVISPITNSVDVDLQNEGDTVLIDAYANVDNGTVTIAANKLTMTFKPTANWNGVEDFTYTLKDAAGATSTAHATVTVAQVNDKPVAVADSATVLEDSSATTINVLANDSDIDFDPTLNNPVTETWRVSAVTQPAGGTVSIASGNQAVNFTPTANWNGQTTFTYTVRDKAGSTATATVTVTVTPVNDKPIATNDSDSMAEDGGTKTINVLTNDIDVDRDSSLNHPVSDSLSVISVTQPSSGGVAAVSADGLSVTFTPTANWNGSVSFTYTISDTSSETSTGTVSLAVNPVNDSPLAVTDSASVSEDSGSNTISVLTNDSDIDFDSSLNHPVSESWNISAVTQPLSGGSVSISSDAQTVKFTPAANWNGTTSFTYTVSDSGGLSATATVSVTVSPVNNAPVAVNDSALMDEDDTAITINVLTNDSDVDFNTSLNHPVTDSWNITSVTVPDYGTSAIAEGNLAVTYTPPADWNGTATFTYFVTDGSGASASAQVTVTVNPVNDPPTISDIANKTINEDTSTGAISFTVGDIDTPLDQLTVSAESSNGVIIPNANIVLGGSDGDRTISITPAADKNTASGSPLTITVTVKDDHDLTTSDTFTVTILPVNDAPVAKDDNMDVDEDSTATIHPLVNDSDVDLSNEGDTLSVYLVGAAGHGTATIIDATTITYAPNANWNGDDSFTYTIVDSKGATATATVYMTVHPVNDAPSALDDEKTIDEDSGETTIDVLANDSDVDFDAALNKSVAESWGITAITQPGSGTSAISADGLSVTYTPQANWNGTTTFTYTVEDKAHATATATVQVTILPVNDAPVANDDELNIDEDAGTTTMDVLANDSDIDFDSTLNHPVSESWSIVSVEQPAHGLVQIASGGLTVTYTPPANWNGTTTFTYKVRDNGGEDAEATVTVNVAPVNDPPLAVDDTASVDEDNNVEIDVLKNDSDIDLDPALNEPVTDSWSITAVTDPESGSVQINEKEQTVTYTPIADWNGEVHFTYTITDGSSASTTATVTVTVKPVNDSPVVQDDSVTLNEDDPTLPIDVLANDSDVDFNTDLNHPMSETWQIVSVTQPSHGSVTIALDSLSVAYTTQPNWNGTTSFTYTVRDHAGEQATGTVSVTVNPQEDSPVAEPDSGEVDEDSTIALSLLDNDVDPDLTWVGDHLTITSVDDLDNCTVEIGAEGQSVTVSPIANFNGQATFTYTVEDLDGNASTALVTVTVHPVNDPPQANDDETSGNEDEKLIIDPLANDTDVDFDPALNHPVSEKWHISEVGTPANGTVIINSGGLTLTYVPNKDWNGSDSFSYTVMDASGATSTAQIDVGIHPVNDPPVISDIPDQAIDEDTSTGAISFTVSDIDTAAKDLKVTAETGNGEIIPLKNIVIEGEGESRTVTVTPAPNANTYDIKPVDITLTVSDGEYSDSDVFAVTILPVDDPPVAVDDTAQGKEDTKLTLDLLANDTDLDIGLEGDSLTIYSTSDVTNAKATISEDGKLLEFVPSANWYGENKFTYTIEDSHGEKASAEVTVTITNVPDNVNWITDPAFYIITPTAGERYKDTQTVHVTWTPAGSNSVYTLQFFNGSDWSTLAENLKETSYDHLLDHTYLHTASAQYRVLANWGTNDYLMDESDFFVIDNYAPRDVRVDLTTQEGIKYASGDWTNGPVTLKVNGGWDLTGTEYEIVIDEKTTEVGKGTFNSLIEGAGIHSAKVFAYDPLKNIAEIANYEVKIDPEAPLVPDIQVEPLAGQNAGGKLDFIFKDDPGGSGNNQLTLPDGTKLSAADGKVVWEVAQDGTYPFTLNDNAGNQTSFAVTLQNGQASVIGVVVTPAPIASETPATPQSTSTLTNPGSTSANPGAGGGVSTGVLASVAVLGLLGLLLLLFPPNLKVVFTIRDANGKQHQKTQWRWVLPPNNKKMKVKVKDADAYEVTMGRILTRSMREGTLTLEPEQRSLMQATVEIPKNAKGKFKANF